MLLCPCSRGLSSPICCWSQGSRPGRKARARSHAICMMENILIRPVTSDKDLDDFRSITRAYLGWLGEDLGFQGVERELASLPGAYAADRGGSVLLAYPATPMISPHHQHCDDCDELSASPIGAVALRCLTGHHLPDVHSINDVSIHQVCEMKRLFVLPEHQRQGVGAALIAGIAEEARKLGYKAIVLDTLERLHGANKLYRSLGFANCQRYNDCPLPGVLYFMLQL